MHRISLALLVVVGGCSEHFVGGGVLIPRPDAGRVGGGSVGGGDQPWTETVVAPDDLDHGISDVFPAVVQTTGGDRVQISVDDTVDLSGTVAIAVGGVPLADVVVDGPRSLHGVVPKEAVGHRDLTLTSEKSNALLTEGFEFRHWTGSQEGIDLSWVEAVAAHPARPDRLFASVGGGVVFRSEDRGATWRELGHGLEETKAQLVVAPGDPDVLIGICSGLKICRSKNAGLTWKPIDALSPVSSLAVDYTAKVIYVGGGAFFASSLDDGRTWNVFHQAGLWMFKIAVDPTTPGRIYGVGLTLLRSDDGGKTWQSLPIDSLAMGYTYGLAVTAAGTVLLSHYHGIFRSADLGVSFAQIPISEPYWVLGGVARDPLHPGRIVVGHNRGLLVSDDDGLSFALEPLWEGKWTEPFATASGELYVGNNDQGLFRLELDGTATPVNTGLAAPTAYQVTSCRGGGEYGSDYAGGLYRWNEQGKRWEVLPSDGYTETLRPLSALHSAAGDRIFWGRDVLDPGASSWRAAEIPGVGEIWLVIADPVVAGGGLALTGSGTYLTRDGGDTWQRATTVTFSAQVGAARVTAAGTEYYVASSQVYRLAPGGGWTPVGPPLPAGAGLSEIAVSVSGVVFANSVVYPNPKIYRLDPVTLTWSEVPGFTRPKRGSSAGIGAAVKGRDIVVIGMDDGILRTMDGGRTWAWRPLPRGAVGGAFVFDPEDDKRVFASMTFRGFMWSKNGGGFDD